MSYLNIATLIREGSGTIGTGDVTLQGGEYVPVSRVIVHPPGEHPPIRADLTAVEVVTPTGSRWIGADVAWIGSDLRVHVVITG